MENKQPRSESISGEMERCDNSPTRMIEMDAVDWWLPAGVGIHQEAAQRLRKQRGAPVAGWTNVDARALREERQLHQIELERQNEELRRVRAVAEEASENYRDLFDFAPVGYFLWDANENIVEVNLAAAMLLGLDRSDVVRKRFSQFVAIEYRAVFADFCKRILRADGKQTCEVRILKGVHAIDVRIEGSVVQGGRGPAGVCRAAVIDISQQKRTNELAAANEGLAAEITARTRMLHDIATMANQAQSPEQAIEYCLQRVAMFNDWCFGHAMLPAADNRDELLPACAWYAKDPKRFRRFREATVGIRLRRGQGMLGRVFARGKMEWTTDLRGDLIERRIPVAEELGIGTAAAFPVLLGDKVAMVLEFFSDRVIQPNSRIADTMVSVGLQVGRVIERAAFEEHLLSIAEEVQRGIAQDLHDDIGQELTGLGLKANTLAEMIVPATTAAGKLAADIASALDRTHDKVRCLGRGVLPFELEEGLLASALEQLAAATSGTTRIRCNSTCFHPNPVFDRRVCMHLYRIAQEAVTNAVRHSRAQNIRISLDQEHGESILAIEDDGVGFSEGATNADGMGRRTMGYRAGLIGGKLEVGPGRSGGTNVVCRLAALTAHGECGLSTEI
jgi:PAS domain S-box-containing protein